MRDIERNAESGSALVFVAVLVTTMAVLSVCLLHTTRSTVAERKGADRDLVAVYVAEAGLSEALMDLAAGGAGNLGTAGNPIDYGGAAFYVQAANLGGDTFRLMSTGTENGATTSVELTVRQFNDAFFKWAAFGDEGMTMDSNARVDSYDSSLGSYDSQDVNGSGSDRYALTNGDVGSNGDIGMSSNATVWGDAIPGPDGVASITGNAVVSGTTLPSMATVDLPPLVLPVLPSTGDRTIGGNTTWASGKYSFDALTIGGSNVLTIQGPAVVLAVDFELRSNAEVLIDDTNGPVEIWVVNDFVMNSNSLLSPLSQNPASFQLYLNSDNVIDPDTNVNLAEVEFDSNAQLFGSIYAPHARIDIDSNFELFGSVVARSVHLDSNSSVHFDENLMKVAGGAAEGYEVLCWRIVANP